MPLGGGYEGDITSSYGFLRLWKDRTQAEGNKTWVPLCSATMARGKSGVHESTIRGILSSVPGAIPMPVVLLLAPSMSHMHSRRLRPHQTRICFEPELDYPGTDPALIELTA